MSTPIKKLIAQHRHCDETWSTVEAAVRGAKWEEAAAAYDAFVKAHGFRPETAAMFEDMPHNLEEPHALGRPRGPPAGAPPG